MEKPFEEFGSLVFSESTMKERLPKPVYLSWKKTVANEGTLDRPTADSIAHAMKLAPQMAKDQIIVITVSGRGDKDCAAIARYRGEDLHE